MKRNHLLSFLGINDAGAAMKRFPLLLVLPSVAIACGLMACSGSTDSSADSGSFVTQTGAMQLTYQDRVPKSVVFGWAEAKPADSTLWTIELKTTTPDANENPYTWKAWALVDTNWTISFQVPRKAGTYGFNNVSLGAMRYSSLEFNSAKPIWTSYSNGAVRITRKGSDSLLIELDAQGSNAEDSTIASTISGRYMMPVVNPDTWVEGAQREL